jgi:transposase
MSIVEQLEAAGEVLSPVVRAALLSLEAELLRLRTRVSELEARLASNSTNSSRPPSSDPPGTTRPKKRRTGKRRGGQKGHPGHHRSMLPSERVDQVIEHRPSECRHCGHSLEGVAVSELLGRHQVVELPPVRAEMTEHHILALCCPACGKSTRARLPREVGRKRFGPRLSALAVLLTSRFRLSRRDQCAFFEDLLDVPAPSLGMTQGFIDEAAAALHPAYQEIRSHVRASPAAGADETGWSLRGETRWIWTATTKQATLFRLGRSRGAQELSRLLGRRFGGLLTSDRWSAYKRHPLEKRQLCWAHLRRNFEGLCLRGGAAAHTGGWGVDECDRLFHAWHRYVRGNLSRTELRAQIRPIRARFRRLLHCGADCESRKTAAMCRNLLDLWPALWSFLTNEALEAAVEPTNNAAERALRRAVLWRKTSFGSQSGKGLRATERLLSVTETARQNGMDLLDYLTRALTAARQNASAPPLLPAT